MKALEFFKDWSNFLLVTTVAALGLGVEGETSSVVSEDEVPLHLVSGTLDRVRHLYLGADPTGCAAGERYTLDLPGGRDLLPPLAVLGSRSDHLEVGMLAATHPLHLHPRSDRVCLGHEQAACITPRWSGPLARMRSAAAAQRDCWADQLRVDGDDDSNWPLRDYEKR